MLQSESASTATSPAPESWCCTDTPGGPGRRPAADGTAAGLGQPAAGGVGRSAVPRLNPRCSTTSDSIAGAIYTPSECAADCLARFAKACKPLLAARGVRFLLGTQRGGLCTPGASALLPCRPTPVRHRCASSLCWPWAAHSHLVAKHAGAFACRSIRSRATASRSIPTEASSAHGSGAPRQRDRRRPQGGFCAHRPAPARGWHGRTGRAR